MILYLGPLLQCGKMMTREGLQDQLLSEYQRRMQRKCGGGRVKRVEKI
jgi:hypothetical protein